MLKQAIDEAEGTALVDADASQASEPGDSDLRLPALVARARALVARAVKGRSLSWTLKGLALALAGATLIGAVYWHGKEPPRAIAAAQSSSEPPRETVAASRDDAAPQIAPPREVNVAQDKPVDHDIHASSGNVPAAAMAPTAAAQLARTAVALPAPAAVAQPAPTAMAQPTRTAAAQPALTAVAQPAGTAVALPALTAVAQPAPTAAAQPAGTAAAQPAPTALVQPAPTAVTQPARTAVALPALTAVAQPAPTAAAQPAPTASTPPAPPQSSDSSSVRTTSLRPDGTPIATAAPTTAVLGDTARAEEPPAPAPPADRDTAEKPSTAKHDSPTKLRTTPSRLSVGKTDAAATANAEMQPLRLGPKVKKAASAPKVAQEAPVEPQAAPLAPEPPANPLPNASNPPANASNPLASTFGFIAGTLGRPAASAPQPAEQTAASQTGDWAVQFGAPKSEAQAQTDLARLNAKYAPALNGAKIGVQKTEVNGETVYALRAAGLSKAEASALCTRLKGRDCVITP